jgi:colicin import membrane protein
MLAILKRSPLAVVMAVLLHLILLTYLVFGLDWASSPKPVAPQVNVVQAKAVDAARLEAEAEKIKQAEAQKKAAEAAARRQEEQRLAELKRKQAAEQKRLAQLEQQRQAKEEEARQRELEAKRQAEAKRKAEVKRKADLEAKQKAEAEAKRKAEAEAKRKAEVETKRKAEAEAKRKAEAEARRKAEAEAKRKAEAEAQAAREQALQEQLAAEQNARELDRYVAVIKQQIERSWLKPANAGEGLSCTVQVRLIPGGDVMPGSVSVIQSSGNAAFDRSVETAVYKAAPLPVPSGSLFESFRTIRLNFKPQ